MKKIIIALLLILCSLRVYAQCNNFHPEIVIFSDDLTKPSRISLCEDSIDFLVIKQYNLPTEDYLSSMNNPLFIVGDENLHLKLKLYKSEYYTTENGNKECYYYYKITKFNLNQMVTKQINYIVIYYDYQVITNELDFKKSIELNYLIETYYKFKLWKLPK